MILMLMNGPGDHETWIGSGLPVCAIFVAVVAQTAHLLKNFLQQGKW